MKNTINKNILSVTRRIASVLLILCMVFSQTACSGKSKKSGSEKVPGSSITPAMKAKDVTELSDNKSSDINLKGIFTKLDKNNYKMYFVDINTGTEYEVPYSGGTDIQSSYDKVIPASLMSVGEIYEVTCAKNGKATKIHGSKEAWSRTGVSDIVIDENSRKISIGSSNLIYESFTVVTSADERINIAQIVSQDELTIRGIGEKVYSISVDKGHGYIKFTGIDSFIGGYASVGSNQLYGITKDMLITAKEGTYSVSVRNGSLEGTKTVTVTKDAETTVDFEEYTTAPTKMGAVKFSVTPENAVMTIDGTEVDYSKPVSLSYGTHRLTLNANYYSTYTETFVVNSSYQTKFIDMTSSSATSSKTTATTAADLTKGYSVKITAPEGASLYVDSVYIGTIPCSFDKSSGKKTITVAKSGYTTTSYTILINNVAGDLTYAFPSLVEDKSSPTQSATSTTAASQ